MAVLKQVASKYPYESPSGHRLKAEAQAIGGEMVALLQTKVDAAGTEVLAFELSDLSYAPEIAQAMLRRQQAEAVIAARQKIVHGAVSMVEMALHDLAERQVIHLDDERKASMVSNLLVVLCGEHDATPVINTGTLYN
jgi:regulator of protease activity HflC (stomatin/prohibitin superfamily)